MPGVRVSEAFKRRLVEEIPNAVRVGLETAMLESANLIVAGAKLRVPVGETGAVHDSIRHHEVKVGKRGGLYIAITAGDKSTEHDGYQVARLLEFGAQDRPAQPFLLPAFRANRRRAKAAMRRAMRDAVIHLSTRKQV
jgi:HK97 gp10 family phage protein